MAGIIITKDSQHRAHRWLTFLLGKDSRDSRPAPVAFSPRPSHRWALPVFGHHIPFFFFSRYSLLVQIKWLKKGTILSCLLLKNMSAILYKKQSGSLTIPHKKVFHPIRGQEWVFCPSCVILHDSWRLNHCYRLRRGTRQTCKKTLLWLHVEEEGSVTTGAPQPLWHMTTLWICFTCRKCGKLFVNLEVNTLWWQNIEIRDAETRWGKIKLLPFVIVLPQEVLLFPAMKPDDNKTSEPAEGTSVWGLLLSLDLCRNQSFLLSREATRFSVFSHLPVSDFLHICDFLSIFDTKISLIVFIQRRNGLYSCFET